MDTSGRVAFRALLGATLAVGLLVPLVAPPTPAAAGTDPQDAEIRGAVAQAIAGTRLSPPDQVQTWPDNYRWRSEFDEFRANLSPDSPNPSWSDWAASREVSVALDGAQMIGDSRNAPSVTPTSEDRTICGQPAEWNLHPAPSERQHGDDPWERSMGPDHEAQTGPDRPRGPDVFLGSGLVYFTLGRFFFRVGVDVFADSQDAALQQAEQSTMQLLDGLCSAFTPLVPATPSEPPTVAPTPTATPSVPGLPTGPVTLEAGGQGWSSDIETVANPDGFGQLDVSGRVIDLADGSGVGGVTVQVTSGGSGSATTAPDGTFSLVVAVPGGTLDTGVMSGVELELSRLAGLTAFAEPPSFTASGSTAAIVATVTDDTGAALAGEVITLTPVDPAGAPVTATTGSDGTARFDVTHDDPSRSSYTWAVTTAAGERVEVVVPVGGIVLATNPATGEPYRGIAADAEASVEVTVRLPADNRIAFVDQPEHGTLSHDGQEVGVDGVVELAGGEATLTYTPPAYLADELLTERLTATRRRQGTTVTLRAARDVLRVGYDDADGVRQHSETPVLLVRPPVMLVHGFSGNETTWAELENYLTPTGFDPVNGNYVLYQGGVENSSIQYQSEKLQFNIAAQRETYADVGLLLPRVDIVAHSMGGLISRHYIEVMPTYTGDVRKLIMAGTPNHGAGPLDSKFASLISLVVDGHQVAGQQLRNGSEFLRALNRGEVDGSHLNGDVQYANLIGRRSTNYAAYVGIPYANDDGVVTTASATLNGVRSWVFDGIKHSDAVVLYGDAGITHSADVYTRITALLSADIPSGTLAGERIELVVASGEVAVGAPVAPSATPVDTVPQRLLPGDRIETGPDGAAVVHLSIQGTRWGIIDIAPSTQVVLAETSPQHVVVRLVAGQARLRSAHPDAGVFDVLIDPAAADPDGWFATAPAARITDRDTSMVVAADPPGVWSLQGTAVAAADEVVEAVEEGDGRQLGDDGAWTAAPAPDPWWEDGAYAGAASTVLGIPVVVTWVVAGLLLLGALVLALVSLRTGSTVPAIAALAGLLGALAVVGVSVVLRDADELPDTDVALALPDVDEEVAAAPAAVPTPSDAPTTPSGDGATSPPPTPGPSTPPATPPASPPVQAATATCTTSTGASLVYDASWQVWDDEDPEFDCMLFDAGPMPTFAEADFAAVVLSPSPGLGFEESMALFDDPSTSVLTREEMVVDGLRAYRSEIGPGPDAASGDGMVYWSIETSPVMTIYVQEGGYASHDEAVVFADQLVISSDWAGDG